MLRAKRIKARITVLRPPNHPLAPQLKEAALELRAIPDLRCATLECAGSNRHTEIAAHCQADTEEAAAKAMKRLIDITAGGRSMRMGFAPPVSPGCDLETGDEVYIGQVRYMLGPEVPHGVF